MVSKEDKKRYNEAYRAKEKAMKKELEKVKEESIKDEEEVIEEEVIEEQDDVDVISEETSQYDENTITLDKETYEYLLSKAKGVIKAEVKEQIPTPIVETIRDTEKANFQKPQDTPPSFMTMIQNSTLQMMASMFPILAIQGCVLGVTYLKNMKSSSLTLQHQSNRPADTPFDGSTLPVRNYI